MADENVPQQDDRYSEREIRKIIERAVELEEDLNNELAAPQVRLILSEIGVSSEATERAMAEVVAARNPTSAVRQAALPALHSATFGVAVGALAATIAPFMPGGALLAIGGMWGMGLMFSGVLVARNKTGKSTWPFQTANSALWLGIGSTFMLLAATAQSLNAGSSAHVTPWAFPIIWGFTSVGGLLLGNYERHEGNLGSRSVVLRTLGALKSKTFAWMKDKLSFTDLRTSWLLRG